jgi:hypothetical protein
LRAITVQLRCTRATISACYRLRSAVVPIPFSQSPCCKLLPKATSQKGRLGHVGQRFLLNSPIMGTSIQDNKRTISQIPAGPEIPAIDPISRAVI